MSLLDANGELIVTPAPLIDKDQLFLNSVLAALPQGFEAGWEETDGQQYVKISNRDGYGVLIIRNTMSALLEHAKDEQELRLGIAQLYARTNRMPLPMAGDQARLARAAAKRARKGAANRKALASAD